MPEPSLDRPGVVAPVGQRVAAGMAEHVKMRLEVEPAAAAVRSIIRAKPAVGNGGPIEAAVRSAMLN